MKAKFKLELEIDVDYDETNEIGSRPYTMTKGYINDKNELVLFTSAGKIVDFTPKKMELLSEDKDN